VNLEYSAILTSYNSKKTIFRALEGVLSQSIPPSEIIVVDDASTDDSYYLLDEYQNTKSNVLLVKNELNLGQSVSRNRAAALAKTNFLIFFDDDDISLASRASVHFSHFLNGADVSYVSSKKIYENSYEIECGNQEFSGSVAPADLASKLLLGVSFSGLNDLYVPSSTLALKKGSLLEAGGFNAELRRLEDVELAIKLSESQAIFYWSPSVVVHRFDSVSAKKGNGIDMAYEKALLRQFEYLIGKKNAKCALLHTDSRRLYFSRSYWSLVVHLLSHPLYTSSKLLNPSPALKRILHDIRRAS
jgi:glycosyltransferase involved in cell wall biosynthesis